jgi:hypothetical protein
VSFVAENTKEGGFEDVEGVTSDSVEEDNGREGLRVSVFPSLSTSRNDTSEAEVSSWSDEESVEVISGGEFMLSNESEACIQIVSIGPLLTLMFLGLTPVELPLSESTSVMGLDSMEEGWDTSEFS